jgi:hypothetical protein
MLTIFQLLIHNVEQASAAAVKTLKQFVPIREIRVLFPVRRPNNLDTDASAFNPQCDVPNHLYAGERRGIGPDAQRTAVANSG